MKKNILNFMFILLLFALAACNKEEEMGEKHSNNPVSTNVEFLKLSDDSTLVAGKLKIFSDCSKVTLKWNVTPDCNLDTTLTSLSLKSGEGLLSIKWQKKLENGNYGPGTVAYKAGVTISSNEGSCYVPLVWADKIDSTKIMKSVALTRGTATPRVSQIKLLPTTVNLSAINGGSMRVELENVSFAILDFAGITTDMNLTVTPGDTYITESTFFNFKWNQNGPPAFDFNVPILFIGEGEGLSQTGYLSYTASGGGTTEKIWEFVSSTPATGGILPNTGAYVDVIANTNQAWNITSTLGVPNTVTGAESPLGNKTLRINIGDNLTNATRQVSVNVNYNGITQRTLVFTQQASVSDDTNLDISAGGANCFIVTSSDKYYRFTPSLNYGNGNFTAGMSRANGTPVGVRLLWQDTPSLIREVQFVNNQIRFKVGGYSGNALLAATNSYGEVVWSWHIWVTSYNPVNGGGRLVYTNDGQTAMDRNLGATMAASAQYSRELGSYGLYYQWGRKNPFLVKYQNYSPIYDINNYSAYWPGSPSYTSALRTVSNPMEFKNIGTADGIFGGTTGTNASCPNVSWWGINSTKTAYDPCPRGYRVMKQSAGGGVVYQPQLLTPQAGRLQCTGSPLSAYPIQGPDCVGGLDLVYGGIAMLWLNGMDPATNLGGSSDQLAASGYSMHIDYGKPVRCVRE